MTPGAALPVIDALVIGGGVSGLTAAFRLQRAGHAVTVLDANPEAGGVMGTRRHEGFLYETGPNSTLDSTPLIDRLLTDLGIGDERRDADAVAGIRYIVRGGALHALPSSPGSMLTTHAFTAGAKWKILCEPFVPPSPSDADETIAQFVRRRLGNEFLDYAIDPFVSGIYAGDPERISVRAAFPKLFALEQRYGSLIKGQIKGARERREAAGGRKGPAPSFSFAEGRQTLPAALARAVASVQQDVRVTAIGTDAGGTYRVDAERAGAPLAFRARAVVLAVPAGPASLLVRGIAPAAADALAAIEYAAVSVVASAYRRADVGHSLAGFGFLVPRRENRRILGTLFSSSMFRGRAPEGSVLMTTFVGGRRNPDLPGLPDAELSRLVHDEFAALLAAKAPAQWTRVTRWPQAIPQYDLGHLGRVSHVDAAEAALPGLHFCASWRGGVSVGDRILRAHATAETVAKQLAR